MKSLFLSLLTLQPAASAIEQVVFAAQRHGQRSPRGRRAAHPPGKIISYGPPGMDGAGDPDDVCWHYRYYGQAACP